MPGITVADLGCGPGTLTRKLARWLGETSTVLGIDRDQQFLAYAREKAKEEHIGNIDFIQGDVLALPLSDQAVDACISYTVVEHVPNREFLQEQRRVCRAGGRVIVMMAQPQCYLHSTPPGLPQPSEREQQLWEPIRRQQKQFVQQKQVGAYWPEPASLPALMASLGFNDIRIDALAFSEVIDDGRHTIEQRMLFVEQNLQVELEQIERMRPFVVDQLSAIHIDELIQLVTERYQQRMAMLKQDVALWDYAIGLISIVTAVV
jgi:ubiquinone/menaquinone biosynthesis C-methylase UbiE